jgi:hypothetical protein
MWVLTELRLDEPCRPSRSAFAWLGPWRGDRFIRLLPGFLSALASRARALEFDRTVFLQPLQLFRRQVLAGLSWAVPVWPSVGSLASVL